jgi:tetratricopeptide (TPR) repeat protein
MKTARWMVIVLLLVPALLMAQAQGRVKGTVTDTKGNAIPDVKIIITCPEISNFRKELVSDKKGAWATIIADATKKYMFRLEAAGFQPIEQIIKPLIGAQTLELPFKLTSVQELEKREQQQMLEQPGIKQLREGNELQAAGKTAEARKKFEEAVQLKPDLYLAWLELGVINIGAGRGAEAMADAEKCLAAAPTFAPCMALGLNASKATGDKAAEEKYTAAYKLANPTDPTMFYNDAVAFLNKGDDAKAKPLLEQALAADPKYPDALFQLGMVYFRLGDTAKAKELLNKFIEGSPDHKEAPTAKEMLKYM